MASPPPIVQYSYDLGNRVVSRTYANGTTASYTYNPNNWILTLDHDIAGTRIAGFAHDFDNEGNKRFEQKLHDPGDSEAYQYDQIYRLIDFKVGTLVGSAVPVPLTQTQYDLDGVGNWNEKIKDGVPENRTHSVTNEITKIDAVPVLSDFNGNTTEDGLYRYVYDEENRLTAVTRKSGRRVVGRYQYDALSRRVAKVIHSSAVSSPVETRYFYDGARIIEEQTPARGRPRPHGGANPAMTTLATYVYGNYIDEILTMDRDGQTFYYHHNSLWSVEALTDGAANVVERYSYDAYGLPTIFDGVGIPVPHSSTTPRSAIGNPWMFTGRQFDEETGLYFYRARYYDAVKGRFLQRDPLGYVDGMNLYAAYFVPNMTDASGNTPWTDCLEEKREQNKKRVDILGRALCPEDADDMAYNDCIGLANMEELDQEVRHEQKEENGKGPATDERNKRDQDNIKRAKQEQDRLERLRKLLDAKVSPEYTTHPQTPESPPESSGSPGKGGDDSHVGETAKEVAKTALEKLLSGVRPGILPPGAGEAINLLNPDAVQDTFDMERYIDRRDSAIFGGR